MIIETLHKNRLLQPFHHDITTVDGYIHQEVFPSANFTK